MASSASLLRSLMTVVVTAVALGCAPDQEPDSDGRAAEGSLRGPSSPVALKSRSTPARVVLLVSIDTLRADHLGIYGYPRPTSPVIDSLGREGVVFEDANSTSPWTLPAHASMFTGLYPNRHGSFGGGRKLHGTIPTLATVLASRGYRTAAAVNSIRVGRLYGLSRGFQEFLYVEGRGSSHPLDLDHGPGAGVDAGIPR